jgi:hypothetical protein
MHLLAPAIDPLNVRTGQMRQQLIDPREITWSATLTRRTHR